MNFCLKIFLQVIEIKILCIVNIDRNFCSCPSFTCVGRFCTPKNLFPWAGAFSRSSHNSPRWSAFSPNAWSTRLDLAPLRWVGFLSASRWAGTFYHDFRSRTWEYVLISCCGRSWSCHVLPWYSCTRLKPSLALP